MHTFFADAGPAQAIATLESLSPDSAAVVGVIFGTWNGNNCQVILVKIDATTSANLIGTASVGDFLRALSISAASPNRRLHHHGHALLN